MALQPSLRDHHTNAFLLVQPLDGTCLSTGRSALRTSVSACRSHDGCLQYGLVRYIQRAGSLGALLCPVRALRIYVDRTRSFRRSEQLFVCHGGQQKGKAVSKQRLAHWIVDAIALVYQSQGEPCPLGMRAHSTRTGFRLWRFPWTPYVVTT